MICRTGAEMWGSGTITYPGELLEGRTTRGGVGLVISATATVIAKQPATIAYRSLRALVGATCPSMALDQSIISGCSAHRDRRHPSSLTPRVTSPGGDSNLRDWSTEHGQSEQ
jgi:hypothetical protein